MDMSHPTTADFAQMAADRANTHGNRVEELLIGTLAWLIVRDSQSTPGQAVEALRDELRGWDGQAESITLLMERAVLNAPRYFRPVACPYTHAHTKQWCGYDDCRES